MKPRIGIRRELSADLLSRLERIASSTLADAMGRTGAMAHRISPVRAPARLTGSAVTARCAPNDNLMLHKALEVARPGDVIVVDTQGSYDVGAFGKNMAIYAMRKGIRGLVIDGSVRDIAALREMTFGVFCAGSAPTSATKVGGGAVNEPVGCGGLIVEPGDALIGDDDGVAVVPHSVVADIVTLAEKREEMEEQQERAVAEDQIPLEILYGRRWVDEALSRIQ